MRALIVSHASVLPANQMLYCEMERLADTELALVVPERWDASVGGLTDFTRHEDLQCPVITKPVRLNGKINMHFYRGLSGSDLPWPPDVIFADEDPYSLAAYQAFRLAQSVGAPFIFKSNQNLPKRYPPPFSWTERAVYRGAAGAIACAEACADVLRQKGYEGPAEVIGFGIDPQVSRPWPTEELRQKLEIPAGAFVIGFMGRFAPEKGVMDVIEACHVLERSLPDECEYHLLMIGDGPQRAELEARAAELRKGRAIFPGIVPHGKGAAEHFSLMDVCVVPSRTTPAWKEQFGRVIIEAMAAAAPVLGSDSGNVPVLVEESGGGHVFPEGDAEALASGLKVLIDDRELARRLGETARSYVAKEYSYRRIAEKMAAVLREAVERAGR